jgi:hypothetical protein
VLARLLVALVVLVGVAVAVAAFVPIPAGPLDEGGGGISAPRPVRQPFTVGMYALRNDSRWPLEVEDVRLAHDVPGLLYLGALTTGGGHGLFAFENGYPPAFGDYAAALGLDKAVMREATETVVPARATRPLFVGLYADRPGTYRVPELEVEYRVRLAGRLGPLIRERLRDEVWFCAQPTGTPAKCDPPLGESEG